MSVGGAGAGRGARVRRAAPCALAPALLALLFLPARGGGAAPAHDLHIAYADLAIEGAVMAGRVRLFKDDLERALGQVLGVDAHALRPGPDADALVMRYLRGHLRVEVEAEGAPGTGVGRQVLEPSLVRSGEDMLDREPVWWVLVQFRAPDPEALERFTVRNTLLFDVFDDQRNIVKFVRFPDQEQQTFYFAPGEEVVEVGW